MRKSLFPLASLATAFGLAGVTAPCWAVQSPWAHSAPVADRELTDMRGGVMLPDGLDVDIGIDIQTQLNGVIVLHTVLSTAAPAAQALRVYVGGAAPSNAGATAVTVGATTPMLTLNRTGADTTLITTTSPLNPTVLVLNEPSNVWPQYPDETPLNVSPNGPAVQTANGSVQIQQTGDNTAVTLSGTGLMVTHLLGDPTGAVVANQLNNQSIQSTTVVGVDLHGMWPATANAMFNVGNLALSSVRRP
jgi:hypothetical protein